MSASEKKFCLTCGSAGVPREPAGFFARHAAKLALAVATSLLVWRYQPQMWWIAAMSLLPVVFDLVFAGKEAATCAKCESTSMIPIDSPRAQESLRAQEKIADSVIAAHDSKPTSE